MMAIRAWWNSLVTNWKKLRPARRRRSLAGHSAEAFEPRRLLSAFVVNSLVDSHDALPGDGIAADSKGNTTLRAALEEANALVGADTITLPAGVVAVSPANGPLVVTDDVSIIGSGNAQIDGTAVDQVFSVTGEARLQLEGVGFRSSDVLAASLRPLLMTTNTRQADLVIAFSAITSPPITAEIKSSNGLSPLIGITTPESDLDETLAKLKPVKQPVPFDDSTVATPEEAIEQIIDALFRSEPDFVLPVGAEQTSEPMSEGEARPMPKAERVEPLSDDEQSRNDLDEDAAVGAVLRGWANAAGWREFDFLTRDVSPVAVLPGRGSRVATMAGLLVGTIAATAWSRDDRASWRESLAWSAWRSRFERLRRRAR